MEEVKQTRTITFAQPFETEVKVIDKTNAKGETQPEIKVEIRRKLETGDQIEYIIAKDIDFALNKTREATKRLKELE